MIILLNNGRLDDNIKQHHTTSNINLFSQDVTKSQNTYGGDLHAESGGRCNKGGNNSELHLDFISRGCVGLSNIVHVIMRSMEVHARSMEMA